MNKQVISTSLAPSAIGPYSQAIRAGNLLFVSGQIPIDPATGQLLWEREGVEVLHLLGVGQGQVIFTTRTPRAGLRAIRAADGSDRGGWFRSLPAGPLYSSLWAQPPRGRAQRMAAPTMSGPFCWHSRQGIRTPKSTAPPSEHISAWRRCVPFAI